MQCMAKTLSFFYPAVKWLSDRLRNEREFCCGDSAAEATGNRRMYNSVLEHTNRAKLATNCSAFMANFGRHKTAMPACLRRVPGISSPSKQSRYRLVGILVVMVTIIPGIVTSAAVHPATGRLVSEKIKYVQPKIVAVKGISSLCPIVNEGDTEADRRAELLKKDVRNFMLELNHWDQESQLLYIVYLSVPPRPRITDPEKGLSVQIDAKEAEKIIDHLLKEGFLANSSNIAWDDIELPKGPACTLCVWGAPGTQLYEDLGWGPNMLRRLYGLRNVLQGDAAKAVDKLLGHFEGLRKEPETRSVVKETIKYLQIDGRKREVNWTLRVITSDDPSSRMYNKSKWLLRRADQVNEEHIASIIAGMGKVYDIKASPSGRYLAILSIGEGAQMLEVVDLPLLLMEKKYKVLRTIDPFPGGVAIERWDGDKLVITSGALLTYIGEDGRVPHPSLGWMSPQKYALSVESGGIEALSEGAKKPVEYFIRKLSSSHPWERQDAAMALKELKAKSASGALKKAVAVESYPGGRKFMQEILDDLEKLLKGDEKPGATLRWVDDESGRTLFTGEDIVRFDWSHQIFELSRRRAMDLLANQYGLSRPFRVYDSSGVIYRGTFVSSAASMTFDGPVIVVDSIIKNIQPPLFKISSGYPERAVQDDIRFSASLKSALSDAGVLGEIDLTKPPAPFTRVLSEWAGKKEGPKVMVELFPEMFQLGEKARMHIHFAGGKHLSEDAHAIEVNATVKANNGKFEYRVQRIFPIGRDGWKKVYVFESTLWGPALASPDAYAKPGPAEVSVQVSTKRKLDARMGSYSELIYTIQIKPIKVTILPGDPVLTDMPADVRKEIEKLHSPDARIRALAAMTLGEMGPKAGPAIPNLILLLGDQAKFDHRDVWQKATFFTVAGRSFGTYVAAEATGALAKIGEPAVKPLIEALKDNNAFVRVHAARALQRIKDKRAVEPLCEVLKDTDENVRSAAAIALGQIGDYRAAKPLTELLADKASRPRQDAINALIMLGRPATKPVLTALRDWRRRESASYILAKTKDPDALEPLLNDLKDPDHNVRQSAAVGLGALGDRRAVKPLVKLLEDPKHQVRAASVKALGLIGEIPLEVYKRALQDEEPQVQINAAMALRKTKNTDATEILVKALKDEHSSVRNGALLAFSEIRDFRAVPAIIDLLRDEDKAIRTNAAFVLAKFRDQRAVMPLVAALEDKNYEVRARASYALGEIKDPQAVDALCTALGDKKAEVRVRAAMALRNIRDKRAVGPLVEALKDPDWEVVIRTAEALGKIGDAQAVEPLISVLTGELKSPRKINIVRDPVRESTDDLPWVGTDMTVALPVIAALGLLGDERATQSLLTALKDKRFQIRREATEALGNIGAQAAVAVLIAVLKDEDPTVRSSAARALGQIKDPRAIEALIAASQDKEVSASAISALRSITVHPDYTWEQLQRWWKKNGCKWMRSAILGSRENTQGADQPPNVDAGESQQDQAVRLARDYLDGKILGTPGGSSEWKLKVRREGALWIVHVPKDVLKTMPGGFPEKLVVDVEEKTVSTDTTE